MNTIKEFYKFRQNGLKVVFLILISAIVTGSLTFQSSAIFPKTMYCGASILFFCSAIYTLFYFIKEFINEK